MAGDKYKRARKGQPLKIPAEVYNETLRLIEGSKGSSADPGMRLSAHREAGIVRVQNNSGSSRNPGQILSISGPLLTNSLEADDLNQTPAFIGEEPESGTPGKVVVLLDALGQNDVGWAVASGLALCFVEIADEAHEYADAGDDCSALVSADRGSCQIIHKGEEDSSGISLCWVRISNYPAESGSASDSGGGGNVDPSDSGDDDSGGNNTGSQGTGGDCCDSQLFGASAPGADGCCPPGSFKVSRKALENLFRGLAPSADAGCAECPEGSAGSGGEASGGTAGTGSGCDEEECESTCITLNDAIFGSGCPGDGTGGSDGTGSGGDPGGGGGDPPEGCPGTNPLQAVSVPGGDSAIIPYVSPGLYSGTSNFGAELVVLWDEDRWKFFVNDVEWPCDPEADCTATPIGMGFTYEGTTWGMSCQV